MAAKKKKAAKKPAKSAAKKAKTAKKPAKKPAARKAASKKKAAPRKKASAAKKTARKAAGKSAKTTAKKAPKTTAKKAAAPAAKKPTKAAAAKAAKKKSAGAKDAGSEKAAPAKKAKPKKPVTPTGPRHPKLGYKWSCYACGAKFYDLGKEEPICPKCEADQRDRPPEEPRPATEVPKPKVVRPMAQLLDDEESTATSDDEISIADGAGSPADEMFDDAENDTGLDIDDDSIVDEGADPPEIDEL